MSTIDERVVELQFNNAQFEAGVQTSINTLEKLKAGLNLEGAAKGLEGLSSAGKSFSLANVADNVQTVADRFSVLGIIGDQVLRRLTDSAIGMGKKLLTAIPNQMKSGGIARAQNIEAAKFQIQGLKESWDDLYSSMDKAVSGTAYGIDAAAKAASQLVASNVAVGTEMDKALRGISGVAAMTNSSYEDIARVFTTVAGNGRLMGDQLNQLSSRGLNVAATLGEALGKSEQEIREMVSRGKISFKEFAEAMDDAFGEHATKANKTFTGALSNIKASLSRMGQKFAAPTFDALRDVFNDLLPVMKQIEKLIQPIADQYASFIKSATVATSGLLRQIGYVAGVDWSKIDKDRAKAAADEAKEIEEIAQMSRDRHKARVEEAKAANESAKTIAEEEKQLLEAEKRYTEATQDRINKEAEYQKLQGETAEGAEKTANQLNEATDKTEDAAKKVDIVRTTLSSLGRPGANLVSVYDDLTGKVNTAAQTVTGLTGNFMSLLGVEQETTEAAEEAAESVADIDKLANDVIKGLYGNGEERKTALENLGVSYERVQNRVNELLGCEKRYEVAAEKETKTAEKLTKSTEEVVEAQEKQLTTGEKLRNIMNGLSSAISLVSSLGRSFYENVLRPFATWAGAKALSILITILSSLGERLSWLNAYAKDHNVFDKIFGGISNTAKKVKDNFKIIISTVSKLSGVKALAETLKKLGSAFKEIAKSGFNKVSSWFTSLRNSIGNFNNGQLASVYSVINNISKAISDFVSNTLSGNTILSKYFSLAKSIISWFISSIPVAWNSLSTFITGLKDSTALQSFLEVIKDLRDIVHSFLSEKIDGLTNWFSGLSTGITKINLPKLSSLAGFFKNVFSNLGDFISSSLKGSEGLKNWYEGFFAKNPKMAQKFKKLAKDLFSGITSIFSSIKKALPQKVQEIWTIVGDKMRTALGGVAAVLDKIASLGKNLFNNVLAPFVKWTGIAILFTIAFVLGVIIGTLVRIGNFIKNHIFVGELLNKITSSLKSFKENVLDLSFGKAKLNTLTSFFSELSFTIKGFHLPKLSEISETIKGLGPSILEFFKARKKGKEGILDWYKNLFNTDPKKAIKIKAIIERVVNTYSAIIHALQEVIPEKTKELWKTVKDTLSKFIGKIDFDKILNVGKLAISLLAVFNVFKALRSFSKVSKNISNALKWYTTDIKADAIRKIAVSIAILAGALVVLSLVPEDKLWGAIKILGALAAGLIVVYGAISFISSKFSKPSTDGKSWLSPIADGLNGVLDATKKLLKSARLAALGAGIMLIAWGLLSLAGALKIISNLDVKALGKNLEAFVVVFGVFGLLVSAAKFAGKGSFSLGASVLAMAYALKILVTVFQDISSIEIDDVTALRTLGIMVTLMAALSGAVSAGSAFSGANVKGFGFSMIEMSGAMWIMAKAFSALAEIPSDKLWQAAIVINITMGVMSYLVSQMSNLEGVSAKNILSLAAIIGVIGLALWKLSEIPAEKLIPTAISLAGVILSLGVALKLIENINWKSALVGVISMAAVLGILVGAFYLIDKFDISVPLETAKSLALLMLSLSVAITILQGINPVTGLVGALGFVAFVGVIGAALYGLAKLAEHLGGAESVLEELEGASEILSAVAKAMGSAIGEFFGSLIGGFATGGLDVTAKNLTSFMEEIEPFIDAAMDIPDGLGTKLTDLGKGLTELFKAEFFHNNKLSQALSVGEDTATIADDFKSIGDGLYGMAEKVGQIKPEDFDNLTPAIDAINSLAAIKIDNSKGLISFLTGDNQLADFTAKLANVGGNIGAFASSVSGVDFSNCTTAATAIAELSAIEVENSGGFLSWIMGDNKLDEFTESLYKVGSNIGAFASSVSGVDFSNCTTAATAIAELSAIEIENSGGFLSWIMGDNKLDDFTESLYKVGSNIGAFASSVNGVDFSSCTTAATAIAELAAIEIKNSGGFLSWIMGDNELADFTAKLANVGGNIGAFASSVSGVDFSNCSAAATAIAELAGVEVDKTGGLWQKLTGENGMGAFAKSLQQMGSALKFYVSLVGGVTAESVAGSVAAVTEIVGIAKQFENKSMGDVLADLFGIDEVSKFTDLSNALKTLAEGVKELTGANLSAATTDLEKLIAAASGTAGAQFTGLEDLAADLIDFADSLGVKKFKDALEGSEAKDGIMTAARGLISAAISGLTEGAESLTTECTAIVNSAVAIFTNATSQFNAAGLANGAFYARGLLQATSLVSAAAKALVVAALLQLQKSSEAKTKGSAFGSAFAEGIKSKKNEATAAAGTLLGGAKDGLKDAYSDGETKGKSFGQGFADGIRSKRKEVKEAAQVLRNAAKAGAGGGGGGDTDPGTSKPQTMGETYGISFALGLYASSSEVYAAGENLSRTVTETLANPLKVVQKVLDSEFDPEITIKPVLDLSDIQNGAKTISRLIPAGATNVGSINVVASGTSRASNDEVLAAIKRLAESMPEGGDTYYIDGITYDDGSAVSDAVRTLVRAAKMQRRA